METADQPMVLEYPEKVKRNLVETTETNFPPELMTIKQFIKHFHITNQCELNWRQRGLIPYVKISKRVYYMVADVIQFMENNKKQSSQ